MEEQKTAPQERGAACVHCGADNPAGANFCRICGKRLKSVCECWVKKEPYDCGQDQCPGYRLFREVRQ